jgi:hypothetical protein
MMTVVMLAAVLTLGVLALGVMRALTRTGYDTPEVYGGPPPAVVPPATETQPSLPDAGFESEPDPLDLANNPLSGPLPPPPPRSNETWNRSRLMPMSASATDHVTPGGTHAKSASRTQVDLYRRDVDTWSLFPGANADPLAAHSKNHWLLPSDERAQPTDAQDPLDTTDRSGSGKS